MGITLASQKLCTGCSACASVCPMGCIEMKKDREGFLQPIINKQGCMKCHKCESVCPILNQGVHTVGETKAYAAVNLDDGIRARSSSGGVFYALAKWTIEQNGVVFGARFNDHWEVIHSYSETIDGIFPFMGSKYVQSTIGDSYKQVEFFLEKGRWVLFSGTPCQINGLKSYLAKEYEYLFTVDIICHGVPSPSVWNSYLKLFKGPHSINEISFRRKTLGWLNYSIAIETQAHIFEEKNKDNLYLQGFLKNYYLRNSCYNCKFKSYHRNSDITLADYWGVDKLSPTMFDDKGTSIVFVHSKKGQALMSRIHQFFKVKEESQTNAIAYNPMINNSISPTVNRARFFRWFKISSSVRTAYLIVENTPFITKVLKRVV